MCKLCAYLFIPQMGRQRRKMEQLQRDITYIIGNERAEGNINTPTPQDIARILNVPEEEVEAAMREME